MIRRNQGLSLATGYRGHLPADLKDLEEILLRISHLAEAIPEISEIDLNPIFALPEGQGSKIVDPRIRIELPQRTG